MYGLAVVCGVFGLPCAAITLLRGEQRDVIPLQRMRGREQVVERTWQALLSTAPTPPLSDEELVG